jgi:NAD(P)-dependent dehydrogenase (short-subunit alcohol dehydrogenase family)
MHPPETYEALATMIPLGRVGQISEAVNSILFFEAPPYITGQIVHIDGGQIAGH